MKPQMHFRKRQLLAYQQELNSQLAAEQTIQIEYPTSPSSLNSGQSSPVGSETSTGGQLSPEKQNSEPIDILSPTSSTKIPEALPGIEENLTQQSDKEGPKPSAIIPAKLNEFEEKSLIQSEDIVPKKETQASVSSIEPTPDTGIDQINKVIALVGHENEEEVIEEMCVVDFNDCYVIESQNYTDINPEYTPQVNDIITLVDRDSNVETDPAPVAHSKEGYSKEKFNQIINRITCIFAGINLYHQRMENLKKEGINVYEKGKAYQYSKHSEVASTSALIGTNKTQRNIVQTPAKTPPKKLTSFSTSPTPSTSRNFPTYPIDKGHQLIIGPNGTTVLKPAWVKIDWSMAIASSVRKVLMATFSKNTLATHTLTGKPSPAFRNMNKPQKKALDPIKVSDIIHLVTSLTNASNKEVRMAITTKCADECKMAKWRTEKKNKKK